MSRPWNPLHDLVLLQDRMNRLFEDATQKRVHDEVEGSNDFERADWHPLADVSESEGAYVIAMDLPGIERSELEINVADNRLVVKGVRNIETTQQQRAERPRGRFIRSFGIPGSVDQSNIGAEYKDGVLKVKLPKQAEQKAKRVEIKVT